MGNYENLKQSITEVIRTNGNQEITGAVLQSTLLTIISTVGANATFAGIATPATNPGTPDGPVFYLASDSGTYTNFGGIELQDGLSILMWNGSWRSQQIFGVDDVPTSGSDNLVKSGGVQEELALGAVYDVSSKNPTAGVNHDGKFESLSALLGDANLDTLIPVSVRRGGMSIKFVKSTDNKYVQYRLLVDYWSTIVTYWRQIDNKLVNSPYFYNISDFILSGYYINNIGNPESEYDNWNSYYIPAVGISKIRVKGLVNYSSARVAFYDGSVSSENLISMTAIDSNDTYWIIVPDKCTTIAVSFKKVDTIEISYILTQEELNKIEKNLSYDIRMDFLSNTQIKTDGIEEYHGGYVATDYIPIMDGDVFKYNLTAYLNATITLYNDNHSVLSVIISADGTFTDSFEYKANQYPTAKYIRFCCTKASLSTSYVDKVSHDISYIYNIVKENEENIKKNEENISQKIPTIGISDTYINTYLNIDTLELDTLAGWTTYRFPVKTLRKYRVKSQIDGGYVAAMCALESENGNYTIIERGQGAGYKLFDQLVSTKNDTAYIICSQNANIEPPFVIDTYENVIVTGKVNAWTQMVESDDFIKQSYPNRVFNSRLTLEALYDYKDVYITEDFVKPSINSSVVVTVNDGTRIALNNYIAIGNLQSFDKYYVTAISGNSVTISLSEDTSPYYRIGDTVPAILNTSYEGKETLSEYSSYIYTWGDILSVRNDNIPDSATIDGIHPTTSVYQIFGKAIADMIKPLLKDETRIVVYGDSWGDAGVYPQVVANELNLPLLNKSRSGDSTMYIRKRFVEDFNNEVISNTDFFIIQMGTNNLFRWGKETGNQFVGPVGQIMKDYKYHFAKDCKAITDLLHGNFIIVPGHAGTAVYNPNL